MSPQDSHNAKSGPIRLPHLAVASPCTEAWEDMPGNERVRHCGTCRQNVYNVSEMTVGQAIEIIREREGRVCIRMLLRRDGTVVTQDSRARLRALRKRGVLGLAAFLLLFIPVTLGAQIFGWFAAERTLTGSGAAQMMGEVASPQDFQGVLAQPAHFMGEPMPIEPAPPAPLMGKVAAPETDEPQALMGDVL